MQPPDSAEVQHAVGERYEVLGLVGAGGMGFVYRARHRALGHIVAVKILPPEVAASAMRLKRFQRSEEHTSELRHGYISYAVFCLKKKKNQSDRNSTLLKTNHCYITYTVYRVTNTIHDRDYVR